MDVDRVPMDDGSGPIVVPMDVDAVPMDTGRNTISHIHCTANDNAYGMYPVEIIVPNLKGPVVVISARHRKLLQGVLECPVYMLDDVPKGLSRYIVVDMMESSMHKLSARELVYTLLRLGVPTTRVYWIHDHTYDHAICEMDVLAIRLEHTRL